MTKFVYLAGPIAGLTFDVANGWRDVAAAALPPGWRALSPLRGKDHLDDGKVLSNNFDGGGQAVARDLHDIDMCDAVIVYFGGAERVSIGTVAEIGYAYAKGKPIIVVPFGDRLHDHVFIYYMATDFAADIVEACDRLEALHVRRATALST